MEETRKTVHSEVAIYARSAFAIGYAKHTDELTSEASSYCLDAMRYAIKHIDDSSVMQVVEQMGSLAGLKTVSQNN